MRNTIYLLLIPLCSLCISARSQDQIDLTTQIVIRDEITKGNCLLVQYDRFFDEQSIKPFGVDNKRKNGALRILSLQTPTMFILPAQSQIPYIIFPGDTLAIYNNTIDATTYPSLKHKYSKIRTSELTFFEYITKQLGPCYGARSYSLNKNIDSYPEAVEYAYTNKEARMKKLDSLFQRNKIRKEFYEIAKTYITAKLIDDQVAYLLKPAIYESLTGQQVFDISDSLMKALIQNPHKTNYPWYNAIKNYSELMRFHLSKAGRNFSETLNWFYNVPNSQEKNFLLFYIFKKEMESNSSTVLQDIARLKLHCTDTSFVEYIESSIKVATNKIDNNKDSDHISSQSDETSTIEEIINRNRGKIIVLDFWASWCQPCLEEVPYSKTLASQFKDSNVIFIMLSSDTYKLRWKNAIHKYDLNSVGDQYIIQDFEKNTFVNKYNISNIPRYMIIGPNGELKSTDAPRPSERTFQTIISNLIDNRTPKQHASKKE